jgi:large subunit ribosomal protein L25
VLHVSDIKTEGNIEILTPADTVIATVGFVREEVVAPAPVEGEVPAEPEVIGKGKKEEEEAGEEPKARE